MISNNSIVAGCVTGMATSLIVHFAYLKTPFIHAIWIPLFDEAKKRRWSTSSLKGKLIWTPLANVMVFFFVWTDIDRGKSTSYYGYVVVLAMACLFLGVLLPPAVYNGGPGLKTKENDPLIEFGEYYASSKLRILESTGYWLSLSAGIAVFLLVISGKQAFLWR